MSTPETRPARTSRSLTTSRRPAGVSRLQSPTCRSLRGSVADVPESHDEPSGPPESPRGISRRSRHRALPTERSEDDSLRGSLTVPPGGFEPPPLPPEGSALSPELWGPGVSPTVAGPDRPPVRVSGLPGVPSPDGRRVPAPPRASRPLTVRSRSADGPSTVRRRPSDAPGDGPAATLATVPRQRRQGVGALLSGARASGATAARTASTTGCAAPGSVKRVDEVWIQ